MTEKEQALLIDFGSTYTKLTAVDLGRAEVIGTAKAPTTVQEDIMIGLENAMRRLKEDYGVDPGRCGRRIACSSAAGGLKMVAVGLVPDLTAEAAKRAALGAGARVLSVLSYELTREEIERMEALKPDIVLLAGGTDGGNRDVILANAGRLAQSSLNVPMVVAGNKNAADAVKDVLIEAGKDVRITGNVMPELGKLNVEPARVTIRSVFMERIVAAKGLKRAENFVEGVVMPTPAAVLAAAELIAKGVPGEPGLGELMIIDIGGATTDVHSVATGDPTKPGVTPKGLPEPYAKRTVEGDLGMRYSALSLVEAAGVERVAKGIGQAGQAGLGGRKGLEDLEGREGLDEERIRSIAQDLNRHTDKVPVTEEEYQIDTGLGYVATEMAVERHVGYLETVYTPFGASYLQYGKDLTKLECVIGTGGVVIYGRNPRLVLQGALFDQAKPDLLKPITPKFFLDAKYILSAVGLLAEIAPATALRVMKRYLAEI
ncbi:MAG: methylaspartate mutase accessory protein GlmL [Firmicutes bacterium]|nr:methylaspartate mutase accessory protein GlmL [Bacillota bacterium]